MRTLSGFIDDQGTRLAGFPVIFINRIKQSIPNATPPRVGYYVVASTTSDSNGLFSLDVDFVGPLMAVSWDISGRKLRPMVIGPIVG